METENPNGKTCPTDQDKGLTQTPPSALGSDPEVTEQYRKILSPTDAELLERITSRLDRDRTEASRIVNEGALHWNHVRVAEAQKTLRDLAFVTPETEMARYRADQAKAHEERLREDEKRKENEERVIHEGKQSSWKAFIEQRGSRYAECAIRNYEVTCPAQEVVVEALREYCRNIKERIAAGVNVLLLGPAGTGKDHLTVALARAAISECGGEKDSYNGERGGIRLGFNIEWTSGPGLFSALRATFDRKGGGADRILKGLSTAKVLYLSDLMPPSGKLTDFQEETAYEVIDNRYNRRLPTWLTLNVASRSEMEAGLGSAIVERLIDGALILQCNWPSYRKKLVTA
jgi:DNA replication protein DnaC